MPLCGHLTTKYVLCPMKAFGNSPCPSITSTDHKDAFHYYRICPANNSLQSLVFIPEGVPDIPCNGSHVPIIFPEGDYLCLQPLCTVVAGYPRIFQYRPVS